MVCYFSIGECSKIGFNFEKHRTSTRFGNFARYATEYLKRLCCSCCSKQKSLNQAVSHVHKIKEGPKMLKTLPTIEEKTYEEDELTM